MKASHNSRATQSTIPQTQSQTKLNFTHKQPAQLTRKYFNVNFNLSSSASLNKIQKIHHHSNINHFSSRLDSVDTKNYQSKPQNNSQDSKLSKDTIEKPQISCTSIKLKHKHTLAQSLKLTNKQNLGQWIKPKYFHTQFKNTKNHSKNKAFQSQNGPKDHETQITSELTNQQHQQPVKIQKMQCSEKFIFQLPNMITEPKYIIVDDFFKPDDIKEVQQIQFQLRPQITQNQQTSFSLINQDLTEALKVTASQTQIKTKYNLNSSQSKPQIHDKRHKSIKDTDNFTKIDSATSCKSPSSKKKMPTNKPSRFQYLYSSPQHMNRDKRYSKFKSAVIDSGKQKNEINRTSLTQSHQNQGSNQGVSPFIVEYSYNRQIRSPKSLEFSELLPSHFSFNSQHSYVKKYQQLTCSPGMFQQSLKDLRHSEEDQEHQYFRYEKNLKKQMYYAKGKQPIKEKISKNSSEKLNKQENKRRVSYSKFVEEIKKKPNTNNTRKEEQALNNKQQNNDQITKKQERLTELLKDNIPEPIAQVRNESSLLSNPTKISSEQSKHDFSRNETILNQIGILQSPLCDKNPEMSSLSKNILQVNSGDMKQAESEIIGLMFRKKGKVQKLKHKLELIRSIENQLASENMRINSSFNQRRSTHLLKFPPSQI